MAKLASVWALMCFFPMEVLSQRWSEEQIVKYMSVNPDRAHFSRLFRDGGFRKGVEVGVAAGRYAEHMVVDGGKLESYTMIEPFVTKPLSNRLHKFKEQFPNKFQIFHWPRLL